MKYLVVFGPDEGHGLPKATVFAVCDTLEQARHARIVSGDLVVHAETLEIVENPEWLWWWERKNYQCYAQRAIGKRLKVGSVTWRTSTMSIKKKKGRALTAEEQDLLAFIQRWGKLRALQKLGEEGLSLADAYKKIKEVLDLQNV